MAAQDATLPSLQRPHIADQDMEEARRARRHERWLEEGREFLQEHLQNISQDRDNIFYSTLQELMLLTLERHLLESVLHTLSNLPPGTIQGLSLHLHHLRANRDCRNPPSNQALLVTATQLAHALRSISSLRLFDATATIAPSYFETFSRLESMELGSCSLDSAIMQSIFSITTLRKLSIRSPTGLSAFLNSESITAFCVGIKTTSSLEEMTMHDFVLPTGQEAQEVAMTLARSKTLVRLTYFGASGPFFTSFCVALSNNFNTKLERLRFDHGHEELDLRGEHGTVSGVEAVMEAKIRNLLKWNVQRTTCPPLFAAIGHAETDGTRKQCLVEALEAVDIPVVFEYITANQNNLIGLIQRLGRCRKRQRKD